MAQKWKEGRDLAKILNPLDCSFIGVYEVYEISLWIESAVPC